MALDQDTAELRQLLLEVVVLADIDLCPSDEGAVLEAPGSPLVRWQHLRQAAAPHQSRGEQRTAVAELLRTVRGLSSLSADELARRTRPIGMPVESALHPGPDWVRQPILGGALDLGLGVVGLLGNPDHVDSVSPAALDVLGIDLSTRWAAGMRYLEDIGGVAARRLLAPAPASVTRQPVLRPIGDADVVTLLGSATFRQALASRDGTGMCSVAVPMRTRGWLDLRALDPAFLPAAAAATDIAERGFTGPLLVTADEVLLPG